MQASRWSTAAKRPPEQPDRTKARLDIAEALNWHRRNGNAIKPTSYYAWFMKVFSLKLQDSLFHDLSERAKSSGTSQSDIIRAALTAYLRGDAAEPQTASCAERASRWIGMVSGPADLATNPEHLAGFGQ